MEKRHFKTTGTALLSSAILIILTMGLHPSGGSLEHIIAISETLMITHGMAIASLPLLLFGFYGLTLRLMDPGKLAVLAFIFTTTSSISGLIAALFNGLALPHFLGKYAADISQQSDTLKTITTFSFAINTSLSYIFIGACCLAIVLYSIIMLKSEKFPKWLGYSGISIFLFACIGTVTGFAFTNLVGFRLFTFSLAAWILAVGFVVLKTKQHE